MDKILHINAQFVHKASSDDELIIEGYANTTDKDRVGDIIVKEAWNSPNALTNYSKNPIILAFHDHSKPIGKMIDHSVTDKGLLIKAKISKAAGEIYQLIKDGILQAFSVGFRVLDADFDSTTDIFVIKDLELHEISVVSVPCNQESVFSVAKEFNSQAEYDDFKSSFVKESESEETKELALDNTNDSNHETPTDIDEEFLMDPKELQDLIAKSVSEAVSAQDAQRTAAEQAAKAAAEKAAAEEARVTAIVESNTNKLIADIEAKMKQSSEASAELIASMQAELKAKSEEVQAILAARESNRMNFTDRGTEANIDAKSLEEAFILSKVTKKGLFETKMGQAIREKAVNQSSSGEVSSDKYEQEVTTRLYEDMKEMLTVQPLFREIQMNSATQVLPINPNSAAAGWINPAATAYGTDGSTGLELTKALTEIVLQTYKLAGKSYITDETEEDAIIPILPLLRDQLVEAHALAIDKALITGTNAPTAGTPDPINGLIARAAAAGKALATTAQADGAPKVTGKMLLQTRRSLGQWGLDLRKLTVVVSLDAYWDLLEDDEFSNMDQVGASATKLTGQVGTLYGMPVIVSTQMPAKAVDAVYAIIVHSDNFLVPRLRGMTVQSDYDVEKQRRVIVSTQRLGFSDIITGEGVATAKYAAANT